MKKCALLLLVLLSQNCSAFAETVLFREPLQYGPPYYNDSKYSYGGNPGNTVSEAITKWWSAYQAYWHVSTCSYSITNQSDGSSTGNFAYITLLHGCGGGDWIKGTPYCSDDSTLVNGMCEQEVDLEKNLSQPECP